MGSLCDALLGEVVFEESERQCQHRKDGHDQHPFVIVRAKHRHDDGREDQLAKKDAQYAAAQGSQQGIDDVFADDLSA